MTKEKFFEIRAVLFAIYGDGKSDIRLFRYASIDGLITSDEWKAAQVYL